MKAVFKREFKAYFSTPLGYVVLAAYYIVLGALFYYLYSAGSPDVSEIIINGAFLIIVAFTIPILTMRLFSEDRHQKTDQILFTSPVKLTSIVLGKFFAALLLYVIGFAPTIVFEIIVASYVSVNIFSFIYALLGMILLGAALISIGMLISSLTESIVVSALLSVVANVFMVFATVISTLINNDVLSSVTEKISLLKTLESFSSTVFSIPDTVYFLSLIAAFLFLTVRSLEKRRWA